jgi:hypothetical protein
LTGNIGISGVKVLTSLTPPPSPRFTGGAEFDFALTSVHIQEEGCPNYPANCGHLTIEEAGFNVLNDFFYGTPVAAFFDGTIGPAPMQYLEVPYADVQYAQMTPCPATPSPTIGNTSLQDLLNRASRDLYAMAGIQVPLPRATCH